MTYNQALEFIDARVPAFHLQGIKAYKADLGNIVQLLNFLENPQKRLKTIHVAGTNGKGSTSHMLTSILISAGYKTGLYTSPHLVSLRERIRVDGQMISEEKLVAFVELVEEQIDVVQPSFFELMTAMSFWSFAEEKCDISVIETGLGGRLDATNILIPELSVITNIGLDHTDLLGDTLPLIAFEKAGIIKLSIPVIIGEKQVETEDVFRKVAQQREAPLQFADEQLRVDSLSIQLNNKRLVNIKRQNKDWLNALELDLIGEYQLKNILTVLAVIEQLNVSGWAISEEAIRAGLKNSMLLSGLNGRWQTISTQPHVVCDTAHNAHGLSYVAKQAHAIGGKLHLILGMVADKNVEEAILALPESATYYFTQASTPRAMPFAELLAKAARLNRHGFAFLSVKEAFEAAKTNAKDNDLILITGSNFLVGDFLAQE